MLSRFVVPTLIISISFLRYTYGADQSLSPFGQKVKSDLSENVRNKLFGPRAKNGDELVSAAKRGNEKAEMILGEQFDQNLLQQLYDALRQNAGKINPLLLFNVYTRSVGGYLAKEGLLNENNINKYAEKYADELKKAAKPLKNNDSIQNSIYALFTATARYFKSLNLPKGSIGTDFLKIFQKVTEKYF